MSIHVPTDGKNENKSPSRNPHASFNKCLSKKKKKIQLRLEIFFWSFTNTVHESGNTEFCSILFYTSDKTVGSVLNGDFKVEI